MKTLSDYLTKNKRYILIALVATFVWGLAAHGYGFLQNSFSHDVLNEFYGEAFGNHLKYASGRFLSPVYRAVFRTSVTLPWMIGLLSLVWIGLSVFLVCRIFCIESTPLIVLVAGIFTVNITVSAISATYLHDLDSDMMSLLFAVAAVFVWKHYRNGWLPGAFFITVSLCFYQAFITVAITLAMFVCILSLMNEEPVQHVFFEGMKAIGMLFLGGLLYIVVIKVIVSSTGLVMLSGGSNGLDKMQELDPIWAVALTIEAYTDTIMRLVNVASPYPDVIVKSSTLMLLVLSGIAIFVSLCSSRISVPAKCLLIALICLLPLGMNAVYILSTGVVHDLMVFAIWLFYLLALLLTDSLAKHMIDNSAQYPRIRKLVGITKGVCIALVVMLIYGNVQTANGLYLKKDQEQDAYLSMMTRVVYRMEDFDLYEPEATPVVFVGLPGQLKSAVSAFQNYHEITGAWSTDVLNSDERPRYKAYFEYVLMNPVVLVEEPLWSEWQNDPRVKEMPSYPEDGCISIIEDVMVVKLGDT